MNKRDISAGRAFVSLYLNQGALQKGLEGVSRRLRSFGASATAMGASIAGAGAAMIAPLGAAVASFVSQGSELQKVATQTGATVEQLTRLQYAADQLSIDPDDLIGGIEELNIRLGETVRDGAGPLAEAFQQLGLDAEQLANTPLPERLGAISDALSGISNETTRGFLADEIFGGDAFKLLPLIRQGSAGIAELADEADRLGATRSSEAVASAATLGQVFADAREAAASLVFEVGAALAPAVQSIATVVVNVVTAARQWISQNAGLVRTLGAVAAGVLAVGGAITAVGLAATAAGVVFGGLATLVGAAGTAIAAITSPVGLVVAAIGGATTAWAMFSESGQRAVAVIRSGLGDMLGTARDTVGGVADALMGGDFALAGEIAMTGLRIAVMQGLSTVSDLIGGVWGDAVSFIGGALLDGNFTAAWQAGLDALAASWRALTAWVVGAAAKMAKAVVNAWSTAVGSLSKGMLKLASEDSVIGKLMSKVLGVDVAAEVKRARELNAKLGINEDPLAAMSADVDRQVDAMAASATASIDNFASSFDDAAAAARENLAATVGGSADDMTSEIDAAKGQLDALSAQAAQEAEKRRKKAQEAGEAAGQIPTATGSGATSSVAASFSAGAIAMLAGNGGPQQEMAKGIKKVADEQRALATLSKKQYNLLLDRLKPAVFT